MYVRRKVFSYSEPEEQLYSVTMTEEEYDLFSEFMEEREFTDWQAAYKENHKKGETFEKFYERMQKEAAEAVERTKNNKILNEGERTVSDRLRSGKLKAGMKGRAYGEAALKHLKNNKVAYGVGAAGIGTAGLAYAIGSHKK